MKNVTKILAVVLLSVFFTAKINAQYGYVEAFPSLPNFSLPIEMVQMNDGTNRFLIAQQRGLIYLIENSPTVSTRKVFCDLSSKVAQSGSETGLLGLALHPDFANNGYFFVNYTLGSLSTIARYQRSSINPDTVLLATEKIILTQPQPFSNHNGGCVRFGKDGYLYISFGDGGSGGDPQGNGQNKNTLLGKILRIDINTPDPYLIPPSNYFADSVGAYKKEIYAYGLRNVWKFDFDSVTNLLYAADVGQTAFEEVDIIENGKNYGWNKMEGFQCYPSTSCDTTGKGFIRPILAYGRSLGISITGGTVYRGTEIPLLYGRYIYGDYGTGRVWAATYTGPGDPVVINELFDSPLSISAFATDRNRIMYFLSYGNGRIMKITGPPTSVIKLNYEIPSAFNLNQNYPNPFNPSTKINFAIPSSETVSLKVYDMNGKLVSELISNEVLSAGNYTRDFTSNGLSSGIYLYKLTAGNFVDTKRMVLLK